MEAVTTAADAANGGDSPRRGVFDATRCRKRDAVTRGLQLANYRRVTASLFLRVAKKASLQILRVTASLTLRVTQLLNLSVKIREIHYDVVDHRRSHTGLVDAVDHQGERQFFARGCSHIA